MIKLDFAVDKEILARAVLYCNKLPADYLDRLIKKYPAEIECIRANFSAPVDDALLADVIKQPFFNSQLMFAMENCERIVKYFRKKERGIKKFLADITNTDLSIKKTVFITAPHLTIAENIKGGIVYGSQRGVKDKNYDIVKIIYCLLTFALKDGKYKNAINENIAYVELARHLNKSLRFYTCSGAECETRKRIYPFWNLFIDRTRRAITLDMDYTGFKYDIDEYEPYRAELSALNIFDFETWLENKKV